MEKSNKNFLHLWKFNRNTIYIYANNELLAKKVVDGETTYYHPDHLGSTTVISDEDGDLVERISYRPYGLPRESSEEIYQFTSQEYSSELGINDYDARQYSPTLKRFLQPDSYIQNPYDPQTLNRYSYTVNNPLKYTDSTGYLVFISF